MVMVVLPMSMGMRVMTAGMIVRMRVIVVTIMAMVTVRIPVRMTVAMTGIGAARRVEGCHDLLDLGAEPMEHRLDDVVAQDQDAVRRDGRSQVAVSDMPGEFDQMERVTATDGVERLIGCRDLYGAAALDRQRVAGCQNDCFREVDQNLQAAARLDHAAAQVTLVMLEHGAAEHWFGRRRGVGRPPDGYGLQHAVLRLDKDRPLSGGEPRGRAASSSQRR